MSGTDSEMHLCPRLRRGVATRGACLAAVALLAILAGDAAEAAAASGSPTLSIGPAKIGSNRAPLSLAVNAGRDADLTLRVNGHGVRDPFTFSGSRLHVADLRWSDGLRPGANRIRVRAETGAGTATATRTVGMPVSALLADAGDDVGALAGMTSRVGAKAAGPAAGKGLSHRWRLVSKPRDAKVALSHRDRRRALVRATTPGTYVLQLDTRRNGPAPAASDRVSVSVGAITPPIGAPINTIGDAGAITIADQSYGGSSDASRLAYVVIERTTRAKVEADSVPADATGIAKLAQLADTYGKGDKALAYLMVISGRSGLPGDLRGSFSGVAKSIGADLFSEEQFKDLGDGRQFSVIGIPGASPGAATVRVSSSAPVSGAITGYLQRNQALGADGSRLYEYVSTERPVYDTKTAASDADQNVMKVGSQTYIGRLTYPGLAGFHVVTLDPLSGQMVGNQVLKTNVTSSGDDPAWQQTVAQNLKTIVNRPSGATVLVQSFGNPKPAGPEWNGITDQLAKLGGNRLLINGLDGATEYALVGRAGADGPAAEASTAYDKGPYGTPTRPPARLVGVLARTRSAALEPAATNIPTTVDEDGGTNLDLLEIAYQPLASWPALAPGAPADETTNAEQYICQQLGFCKAASSCPDLRSCYWQKPGSNWALKYATLSTMPYPGDGQGFGSPTFEAVKATLKPEVAAVANVNDYLDRLQEPLIRAEGRSYVDLQGVGQGIYDSLQRPAGNSIAPGLNLISAIAGIFGLLEGPVGQMGAGLAASFTFASAFADDSGQPILGDDVKARASQMGEELFDRVDLVRHEMSGLGLLLVSDYGKLMAADGHVDSDWSLPDKNDDAQTVQNLRTASKQWFYEALVPVAYPYLVRANSTNARNLDCHIPTSTRTDAWPNQPDDAQLVATVGYGDGGAARRAVFFFTRGIEGGSSPPAGVGDSIFAPKSYRTPGVGIEKLEFFTPAIFNGRIAHAIDGATFCDVGWLPNLP